MLNPHHTSLLSTTLQGKRQVGIIAGEPGIGKTALIDALIAQVSAEEDRCVGHGQYVASYGAGEPYLPVLEALGRQGRGPDGPRLVSVLRQYAPSWLAQLPALLPAAAWEALQRAVGPTGQTRMRRELTEALDAFTAEHPLVLVLEDLHWSDRATLDWLASVARRPDPARLLRLGTYRPGETVVQAHPLRAILTSSGRTDSVRSWRWTISPSPRSRLTWASASRLPDWRQAWRAASGNRPARWQPRWRCICCGAGCCRKRCRICGRQGRRL
jgi:hypothetical protein